MRRMTQSSSPRKRPWLLLRWLKTVRYFPISALWHRLRLRALRLIYRPVQPVSGLMESWRQQRASHTGSSLNDTPPLSFYQWQFETDAAFKNTVLQQGQQLIHEHQASLLNEPFTLFDTSTQLTEALCVQTPLWQENYGYLEFLLPAIYSLTKTQTSEALSAIKQSTESSKNALDTEKATTNTAFIKLLSAQILLFDTLDFKRRCWSTYGVSRRLLTYVALTPYLSEFTEDIQKRFWDLFYEETCFLEKFLEWDIQGNHLIRNLNAWLAATSIFLRLSPTQEKAKRWQKKLLHLIPTIFEQQILADGVHFERIPMYHLWVLQDLLECLTQLNALDVDTALRLRLENLAVRMLKAAMAMQHSSGQIPLLGDASLPQTPSLPNLCHYAHAILSTSSSKENSHKLTSIVTANEANTLTHLPQADLACFRLSKPNATLIFDCGDFGPRSLPAHSHCDLGSIEIHVENQPVVVDSGVADYSPSLLRDYFRGTGAHNTLWVPGEEQAEIWGGFRVSAHPEFQGSKEETTPWGKRLSIRYENHNAHYQHQRSVSSIDDRFWIIHDQFANHTLHSSSATTPAYSLLHIHPSCTIQYKKMTPLSSPSQDSLSEATSTTRAYTQHHTQFTPSFSEQFKLGESLWVIPFGGEGVEWSDQSPWRHNLNLYSAGFSQAQRGQLIALHAPVNRGFGWILIPLSTRGGSQNPTISTSNNALTVSLQFSECEIYHLHLQKMVDHKASRTSALAQTPIIIPLRNDNEMSTSEPLKNEEVMDWVIQVNAPGPDVASDWV